MGGREMVRHFPTDRKIILVLVLICVLQVKQRKQIRRSTCFGAGPTFWRGGPWRDWSNAAQEERKFIVSRLETAAPSTWSLRQQDVAECSLPYVDNVILAVAVDIKNAYNKISVQQQIALHSPIIYGVRNISNGQPKQWRSTYYTKAQPTSHRSISVFCQPS